MVAATKPIPPSRLGMKSPPTPYAQAKRLQQIAMQDCENPKTKPHIRAALMRAWCDLEERKRVLKMKPLPRPIDTEKLKQQRRDLRAARQPKQPLAIEEPPTEQAA